MNIVYAPVLRIVHDMGEAGMSRSALTVAFTKLAEVFARLSIRKIELDEAIEALKAQGKIREADGVLYYIPQEGEDIPVGVMPKEYGAPAKEWCPECGRDLIAVMSKVGSRLGCSHCGWSKTL